MEAHTVCCNNCDWEGNEEQLFLVNIDSNEDVIAYEKPSGEVVRLKENEIQPEFIKGCPNCLTDSYLADILG